MHQKSALGVQGISDIPTFNDFETGFCQSILGEPYLFSVMNYQNMLNLELLKNQNLIANYVFHKKV